MRRGRPTRSTRSSPLDRDGLGELIRIGVARGRAKKKLKIGICGEHGGEPSSIEFLSYPKGFDYVSCSPFRVPIARLAAAQAALAETGAGSYITAGG